MGKFSGKLKFKILSGENILAINLSDHLRITYVNVSATKTLLKILLGKMVQKSVFNYASQMENVDIIWDLLRRANKSRQFQKVKYNETRRSIW